MYTLTEKCHRFYEGDQWHGLQSGDEELPVLNFIKPICRYKIAMVAMNDTAIIFSPMDDDPQKAEICDALTEFAAAQWEKGKLDSKKWAVVKNACITGDHYLYCFDDRKPSNSVVTDMTPRLKMLSLIHISEPTRQAEISYAVFCLKKKKIRRKMAWI